MRILLLAAVSFPCFGQITLGVKGGIPSRMPFQTGHSSRAGNTALPMNRPPYLISNGGKEIRFTHFAELRPPRLCQPFVNRVHRGGNAVPQFPELVDTTPVSTGVIVKKADVPMLCDWWIAKTVDIGSYKPAESQP